MQRAVDEQNGKSQQFAKRAEAKLGHITARTVKAKAKTKFNKVKERNPVPTVIGLFLYFNIAIALALIFHPVSNEVKVYTTVTYFLLSLCLIFLIIKRYYENEKHPIRDHLIEEEEHIYRYRLYKKAFYLGPLALTIFMLLYYANSINLVLPQTIQLPTLYSDLFSLSLTTLLLFVIVYYTQIFFTLATPSFIYNEVYFHKAQRDFKKALSERQSDRKLRLLASGLTLYDSYLRRELNLQINDCKKICSKIMTDSKLDTNEQIDNLARSFSEEDKLKPIKSISMLFNDEYADKLLIKISTGQRIREYTNYFVPMISVMVTITGLILGSM